MTTATAMTVGELFADDGYLKIRSDQGPDHQRRRQEHVPGNIEGTIKTAGSLIGNVCAIGDGRPYNVALITLDPDAADGRHADDPEVLAAVDAQVQRANERLARVEQIKHFTVLPRDWLADGDELTPTSKVKRRAIVAKHATVIEGMYAGR